MLLFPLSFIKSKKSSSLPVAGIMLAISIFFSSCYSVKTSTYFKTLNKDTTLQGFVTNDFESKIQKKDMLSISISSLSMEMDAQFNSASSLQDKNFGPSQAATGYLVNDDGTIQMHYLGKVQAEGLTRRQLKEKLQKDLLPYLKDPIIGIQYLNHKVTVLGEVVRPQVINMPEEQLPLIDVIVSSGDLKENASRKDILIIRENGNEKKFKHVNLEDHSIFSSPWYYLQPNDIVYVIPDSENYMKQEKRRSLQTTVSLAVSVVSLLVIILNSLLR